MLIPHRFTNLVACGLFRLFSSLKLKTESNTFKISFDQSRHSGCEHCRGTIPHPSKRRPTALASLAFGAVAFVLMQTYPDLTSSLYFTMSKANKRQQQQAGFLAGVTGVLERAMKAAGGPWAESWRRWEIR